MERTSDDRWGLLDLVGQGATARVYRAQRRPHGPLRAAKVLRARFSDDARVVGLFAREAQALAAVEHPNVVHLVAHDTSAERPYIITEFLAGLPLSAYVSEGHPTHVPWLMGVVADVAVALRAVHRAGWVHGDIKPSNVIIARGPQGHRAHLIDFGVSAPIGEVSREVTGTPHFYPPERVDGGARMPANDLYSLGVLIYKCATGRTPFAGGSLATILRRHAEEPIPEPALVNPAVPSAVNELVRHLVDKRPERRGDIDTLIKEAKALNERLANGVVPLPRPVGRTLVESVSSVGSSHAWSSDVSLPPTVPSAPQDRRVELRPIEGRS